MQFCGYVILMNYINSVYRYEIKFNSIYWSQVKMLLCGMNQDD